MARALPRLAWLFGAGLLVASIGTAQVVVQSPGGFVGGVGVMPYYGGWGGGGWDGGGWGWGVNNWGAGSTPAGSYLTGMANAIRAEGEFNLNTSAAAVNLAEARRREIENRKLWTNTYFEMRRINQAYTNPQRPPRPPETWARLAANAAPDRLDNNLLDPVNGQIVWPSALLGEEFAPERGVLEHMFAQRAMSHGAIGTEGHATIRRTVDTAMAKLRDRIREIDTRSYLEARNFLRSLGFEASFASAG